MHLYAEAATGLPGTRVGTRSCPNARLVPPVILESPANHGITLTMAGTPESASERAHVLLDGCSGDGDTIRVKCVPIDSEVGSNLEAGVSRHIKPDLKGLEPHPDESGKKPAVSEIPLV